MMTYEYASSSSLIKEKLEEVANLGKNSRGELAGIKEWNSHQGVKSLLSHRKQTILSEEGGNIAMSSIEAQAVTEQQRVAATCLKGSPLYKLVREAVLTGDMEMLGSLKDAGHFNFVSSVFKNHKSNPEAILHESALPMIDALSVVLSQQAARGESFELKRGSLSKISVSTTAFFASNEVKKFIKTVCEETLAKFVQLTRSCDTDLVLNENLPNYLKIREATLAIVAAFACATNDPVLLVKSLNATCGLVKPILKAGPLESDHLHLRDMKVSPALYAIQFAAHDCIGVFGSSVYNQPLTASSQALGKDQSNRVEHRKIASPEMIGDYLDRTGNWGRPQMAAAVFSVMTDNHGKLFAAHEKWASNSLPEAVIGGNFMHLKEMILEKFPDVLKYNRDALICGALDYADPQLLSLCINDIAFPPSENNMLTDPDHPVFRILNSKYDGVFKEDQDMSIVNILNEMQQRGILDKQKKSVNSGGVALVHLAVSQKWINSIICMIAHNFDFNVKNATNSTPLQIAVAMSSKECINILKMENRREDALAILNELNRDMNRKPALAIS